MLRYYEHQCERVGYFLFILIPVFHLSFINNWFINLLCFVPIVTFCLLRTFRLLVGSKENNL